MKVILLLLLQHTHTHTHTEREREREREDGIIKEGTTTETKEKAQNEIIG